MRLMIYLVLVLIFASACSSSKKITKEEAHKDYNLFTLKDGKWKEDCVDSKLGMIIKYDFAANKPLNFNIHWHKKKHVTYSVKHEGIESLKGSFEPTAARKYCLSWYAGKDEVVKAGYKFTNTVIPKKVIPKKKK